MRINLNQQDIDNAIKAYLSTNGMLASNQEMSIVFKAGRKGSGLSATVDVTTREDSFSGLQGDLGDPEERRAAVQLVATAQTVSPVPVVETPLAKEEPAILPKTPELVETNAPEAKQEDAPTEAITKKVSLFG